MSDSAPRVWFITGTSTGLGRAVAEVALEKGDIVVGTARRPSTLDDLAQRYPKDRLLVLPLDVTRPDQVVDAFAEAARTFGRIDVVLNNAGKADVGEFEGIEDATARDLLETNFWGAEDETLEEERDAKSGADTLQPSSASARRTPPGAGGRLIQVSSLGGLVGMPACSFYCAAKFALEGASETLAAELDPAWNIKLTPSSPSIPQRWQVTIIEPGWIRTEVAPRASWSPEHPAYNQNPALPTTYIRKAGWDKVTVWKDARRSAEAFYKVACLPDPPLRVLVGKDAINATRKKIAALAANIDTFEALSEGLEE
uniref:Mannitol 1-phosphate dehydrogenase n=1 Tax=Ganoderma boninense TaxID=34458 RepID=A0A5K1K086_9APHY|nr:Mannitol 1-phosphate dehydrogenase [Ganoderma boninense]